jgi:hypothetical protein
MWATMEKLRMREMSVMAGGMRRISGARQGGMRVTDVPWICELVHVS